jgi:hypothetical protein
MFICFSGGWKAEQEKLSVEKNHNAFLSQEKITTRAAYQAWLISYRKKQDEQYFQQAS